MNGQLIYDIVCGVVIVIAFIVIVQYLILR
jgi:hypothetical protein